MSTAYSRRLGSDEPRLREIELWLRNCLGDECGALAVVGADASTRRYFRVAIGGVSRVVMDAMPGGDEVSRFLYTGALLRDAGLHAPVVHAVDTTRGLMLLEDLGRRDYLAGLHAGEGEQLMPPALRSLVRWQTATRKAALPAYSEALLRRELALFPQWYLARHRGITLTRGERTGWEAICDQLVARALAQPRVFVHRDYMARNLLISEPMPGVIDHQDAVIGPLAYDLAALLRDAFWEWSVDAEAGWIEQYRREAEAAGLALPAESAFRQDFDWIAVQRHLKILGLFARLNYRDEKPRYFAELPRFARYIRREAAPWPELAPLLELFERHGIGEKPV